MSQRTKDFPLEFKSSSTITFNLSSGDELPANEAYKFYNKFNF